MTKPPFYIGLEEARQALSEIGINLTPKQIKRAADPDAAGRRKLPFFVDPIDGRLKIERGTLWKSICAARSRPSAQPTSTPRGCLTRRNCLTRVHECGNGDSWQTSGKEQARRAQPIKSATPTRRPRRATHTRHSTRQRKRAHSAKTLPRAHPRVLGTVSAQCLRLLKPGSKSARRKGATGVRPSPLQPTSSTATSPTSSSRTTGRRMLRPSPNLTSLSFVHG